MVINAVQGHQKRGKHKKQPSGILFSSLNETMAHFYWTYNRERDRLHAFFFILILYYTVPIEFKKVCQRLFIGWPNGAFQIHNSKCWSGNVFGEDFALLNNQGV